MHLDGSLLDKYYVMCSLPNSKCRVIRRFLESSVDTVRPELFNAKFKEIYSTSECKSSI